MEYLRDMPEVALQVLKDCVVWDVKHNPLDDRIEYTLEHARFPKHMAGQQIIYVWPVITTVDDGRHKWREVSWKI